MVATVLVAAAGAFARPLEAVQMRGAITLCAHANALPFSSKREDPPGFQIELARALARHLGVELAIAWVVTPNQYRTADCDIVLDTIVDDDVQAQTRLRTSRPYQRSGVALALPAEVRAVQSFDELDPARAIGVQVGSLAQMVLAQRGLKTVPYAFEDDIVEEVSAGKLGGGAVSPATIGYFNLKHPDGAVRLVHAYERTAELSWNLAIGLRASDAPLRDKIDAALMLMLSDGTVRDIYARYGIEHRPPGTRP
jgi:polar amino acid transport system substrate-binding protein